MTRNVLIAARSLVAAGWIQGAFARNAKGDAILATAPDADRFCLVGAVFRVERNPNQIGKMDASPGIRALRRALDPRWVALSEFNDSAETTKANVIALFDRAIAMAGTSERGSE